MSFDVLSLGGGHYIWRGEEIYYTFVIMRKMVWQFLNTKYSGVVIYHQIFNLSDKLMEKFITDKR